MTTCRNPKTTLADTHEICTVFVYGTLAARHNHMFGLGSLDPREVEFVGDAETTVSDFQLFAGPNFPAVKMGGANRIRGEVWRVTPDVMRDELDRIEGYPEFYDRRIINTTQGQAWIYFLPGVENRVEFVPVEGVPGSTVEWTPRASHTTSGT